MSNLEHLELLKQGATNWNKWRKSNQHIQIDLRECILNKIHLPKVDLRRAFLERAKLRWA